MQTPHDAMLLRIFFGKDDRYNHLPLHEAVVLKAREMHLQGATVVAGHVGFGHSTRIHKSGILHLSEDLPIVVEIVDSQEKIDALSSRPRRDDVERTRYTRKSANPSLWR